MPPEHHPSRAAARIDQTAAQWAVRQERGLTSSEADAFALWQAADPAHRAAYARIASTWQALGQVSLHPGMADLADAVIVRAARRKRRQRQRIQATLLLAAAAAVAFTFITHWQTQRAAALAPATASITPGYQVLASTARQVTLPDGSVAELNGDSQIVTAYSPTERRVRLLSGEAHFVVTKDAARPFLVEVESIAVRAVGTAFNVRLAPRTVEVLVTEGVVAVNDTIQGGSLLITTDGSNTAALTAGQKVIVSKAGQPALAPEVHITSVAAGELDQALAWQSTRLVFDHTPLDEVVTAFNSYNQHRLVLSDPSLRERTLTGVFRADNVDGFLRLLEAGADVTPKPGAPGITVLWAAR